MFNEKEKLAPDREQLNFGFDNNYEYKLYGNFSGQTVYEPASNGFYPNLSCKNTNSFPPVRRRFSGASLAIARGLGLRSESKNPSSRCACA